MYEERYFGMMKKFLLTLCLLLTALCSQAQTRKIQNRPYLDQRRFHYGFLLGFHMQDMELKNTGAIDQASGELDGATARSRAISRRLDALERTEEER